MNPPVILITGALTGIGRATAIAFAREGARVAVRGRREDRFVGGSEEAKAGFLSTVPARRAAGVEEIAQTIVFLASDKARYITGECILIDGGYTAQ